jgi:hypothetical protein
VVRTGLDVYPRGDYPGRQCEGCQGPYV